MKIYFAASIRGGRDMAHVYPGIVDILKANSHEVLSEMFADQSINARDGTDNDDNYIYRRDMEWIEEADAVVAEVTQPSLGVGLEIGVGLSKGKRIVCLYNTNREGRLSAMISGSPDIKVIYYQDISEIDAKLPKLLQ